MNDKHPDILTDPFDSDPELQAMDRKLKLALSADPQPELAEKIHRETLEELNLLKLDQLLTEALAVNTPADLSTRCYQASVEDLDLQQFSGHLSEALAVESPAQLSEKVYQASIESHQLGTLEHQLHQSLSADSPVGLADRVYAASQDAFEEAHQEQPAVVGRIGYYSSGRFLLRAAIAVFGMSVGVWMIAESFREETFVDNPNPAAQILDNINEATSTAYSTPELTEDLDQIDDQLDKLDAAIHTEDVEDMADEDDLFSQLNAIKE